MKVYGYLRTILIESWIGFPDFRVDFVDFWISEWISGFQIGFLDFTVDFWISGFQLGFLDFTVDFCISVWISADGVRDFFRDGPLGLSSHNSMRLRHKTSCGSSPVSRE